MPNYHAAQAAFTENLRQIDPARDPLAYNLYAGLIALTTSLQSDVQQMKDQLDRIERDLRRPK
jgi:hypothetical protein